MHRGPDQFSTGANWVHQAASNSGCLTLLPAGRLLTLSPELQHRNSSCEQGAEQHGQLWLSSFAASSESSALPTDLQQRQYSHHSLTWLQLKWRS